MAQIDINTLTIAEIERRIKADTYRAGAIEAYKRAGVAMCDKDLKLALSWQERALVYERNAYVIDGGHSKHAYPVAAHRS